MDFNKLILLFNTLKHLRSVQIFYRGYYFIRNKFLKKSFKKQVHLDSAFVEWKGFEILYKSSYKGNGVFEFLNLDKTFRDKIDWNYSGYGKLWTYNINYFDFLNQDEIELGYAIQLIKDYVENDQHLLDGKEPYPISLRGINWIKFLSKNKINNNEINQTLYNHYCILSQNIEYHLLGNHLLENGFSLLFGAYYFKDEKLLKKAHNILIEELKEQILADGAHFELSPMYHQIILHRLLDCIKLLQLNSWKSFGLLEFLIAKAEAMLGWLDRITYRNGDIPMVNDSAYNIAPNSSKLFEYALKLRLIWSKVALSESGYRKIEYDRYEMFLDIGNIGPSYQPGHSHSDTFNFEIHINERPFIVDTGTSTYEKNRIRQKERSTSSHNTVQIGAIEQSQIWGSFRVGNRAKIIKLSENECTITATHNGYKNLGVFHVREYKFYDRKIILKDILENKANLLCKAYFHLHPEVKIKKIDNTQVSFCGNITIEFEGASNIDVANYNLALGFNKIKASNKIIVYFEKELISKISI